MSLRNSPRSQDRTLTVYEQESFTDVGDWFIYMQTGSQGSTALTAGETAPGSSNSDWLKLYYDQDHSDTYIPFLALGINEAELGLVSGDAIKLTADIYLDGPWDVHGPNSFAPGERRFFFAQSFIIFPQDIPVGQETSLSLPDTSFQTLEGQRTVGSFANGEPFDGDTGESFPYIAWLTGAQKAGCSMYLRDITITVERRFLIFP